MCLLQWCHFFTMLVSKAGNSPAYNNLVANVELELHIVQYLCVYFNYFFSVLLRFSNSIGTRNNGK